MDPDRVEPFIPWVSMIDMETIAHGVDANTGEPFVFPTHFQMYTSSVKAASVMGRVLLALRLREEGIELL